VEAEHEERKMDAAEKERKLNTIAKYKDKTSVWYVKAAFDYGATYGLGANVSAFQFSSPTVMIKDIVIFFGPSGGLGFKLAARNTGGSSGIPSFKSTDPKDYCDGDRISCHRAFSLMDLHDTTGGIFGGGLGVGLIYSARLMSAEKLFDQQTLSGWGISAGAAASVSGTVGKWKVLRLMA
jgi:hypothetical protein